MSLTVYFNLDLCCPSISGTICLLFEVFSIDLGSLCCVVLFAYFCILCDLLLFSGNYINLAFTKFLRLVSIFSFLCYVYRICILYHTLFK